MKLASRFLSVFSIMVALFLAGVQHSTADPGPAHRHRLPRPVKLGSSGGNVNDQTSQFCCSGTLGAVVQDAQGKKYVLSNNHVLGMNNKAHVGDVISQPGNIDVGCFPKQTDTVALLTKFQKTLFGANTNNKIDASIAEVLPNMVSPTGFIIDVKSPGQPADAQVGMKVKKSGRTSGLRRGVIETLNLTVRVQIPNQCGSSAHKIARYIDQIGIVDAPGGTPPPFIASGDSGSLLVKDVANCPATIGLLFAGDDAGNAVANRIQNVLTILGGGMKMVGCAPPPAGPIAEDASALTMFHPAMLHAASIQSRYQDALFSVPGVIGVGIGFARPGSRELALIVYTERGTQAAKATNMLPMQLEGMPIRKKVTGPFVAF